MTTISTDAEIACPSWCTVTAREHADDLDNQEGVCLHWSRDLQATDTEGYRDGPNEHWFAEPATVRMAGVTTPAGQERATPTLHVDTPEAMTFAQAERLVEALQGAMAAYRADANTSGHNTNLADQGEL